MQGPSTEITSSNGILDQLRRPDRIRRLKRRIHSRLYLELNHEIGRSIFLAGCQRSGSTWLSETINYRNSHRYIFEPFRHESVPDCAEFAVRQYIRPTDRDPRFLQPAERILSGRIRNHWADNQNRRFLCTRRLIKEIRSNLFLNWLHVRFPVVPIILLLRHPCAVIQSRLNFLEAWSIDPRREVEELFDQPQLVSDHIAPFRRLVDECRSPADYLTLAWAIEHYVPLRQFGEGEIHVIFYEHLCQDPLEETRSLFSYLGWKHDSRVAASMRRPSKLARSHSAIVRGLPPIDSWVSKMPADQRGRCIEIIREFGLDRLYDEKPIPRIRDRNISPFTLFG